MECVLFIRPHKALKMQYHNNAMGQGLIFHTKTENKTKNQTNQKKKRKKKGELWKKQSTYFHGN